MKVLRVQLVLTGAVLAAFASFASAQFNLKGKLPAKSTPAPSRSDSHQHMKQGTDNSRHQHHIPGQPSNASGTTSQFQKNGTTSNGPVVIHTPKRIHVPKIGPLAGVATNTGSQGGSIKIPGNGSTSKTGNFKFLPKSNGTGATSTAQLGTGSGSGKWVKDPSGKGWQWQPGGANANPLGGKGGGTWVPSAQGWQWQGATGQPLIGVGTLNINGPFAGNVAPSDSRLGIPFAALGALASLMPPPYFPRSGGGDFGPPVMLASDGGFTQGDIESSPPVLAQNAPEVDNSGDFSEPAPVVANAQQIAEIYEGPAQNAGLKDGDIILAVNERRVRKLSDLVNMLKTDGEIVVVFYSPAKDAVEQRKLRPEDGRIGIAVIDVNVDIDDDDQAPPPPARRATDSAVAAGPDSPPPTVTALRITEVKKGPAARAGLQAGDILLGVNGQPVRSGAELDVLLNGAQGDVELAFYSPEERKADTRRVALQNGSVGLSFELITVATTQ